MNFPVIGSLVTDILAELHDACPNTNDRDTLMLHALHYKIAADQYFQAIFEMAAATDPEITEAVSRIKLMVAPAFSARTSAEVFPFPGSSQMSSPAKPAL